MVKTHVSRSATVRARLSHPVIDADGHFLEVTPILMDYLEKVGGADMVKRYTSRGFGPNPFQMSIAERRDNGTHVRAWWYMPGNTRDRATASLPRLLNERMEELGMDFSVLYGTIGLAASSLRDDDLRRAFCRAVNIYQADLFREFADRMTPVAIIPMHTPEEAIGELEYVVHTLGLKAAVISASVLRPVPAVHRAHPDLDGYAYKLDTFGLDSEYDYDPFWAKCVELRVPISSHANGHGWGSRQSPSNYVYNQIGKFAVFGDAFCKALFLGGVTRRFPTLNFAFMEGGVGWACTLYSELLSKWTKRGGSSIRDLDPLNMDRELMSELVTRYGEEGLQTRLDEVLTDILREQPHPEPLDDFSACGIERAEQVRDLFVPRFYFGCEGDDPMAAWAFNAKANPFGARLGALFGSDIGHWDVPDMTDTVGEAYEMVEKELISEEDFRDFSFANCVRLYGEMNPDFYKGTRVEAEAARELGTSGA